MKKTLGLILSLMLVLTIFVGASVTASAETGNGLNFALNEDGVSYSVIGYNADVIETDAVIPSSYNDLPVTSISNSAFYNADKLTAVTIPDTVTSIGNTAFYGCINLSTVVLPDSVVSIGTYAFFGCDNVTITASCDSYVVEYAKVEAVNLNLQHEFKEDGRVALEPTYKTEGSMAYECYGCDIEKYEPIAKLVPPTVEVVDDELVCLSGDKVLANYTGLAEYEGSYVYLENSVIKSDYIGLVFYCDDWYYWESDIINFEYTGLVYHYGGWYYVENGVLNWNYTGLAYHCGGWYYVENGVLNWNYTGLANHDGGWYYVENGVLNWNYTGLVEYYGTWYYVECGVLNWNYIGLVEYYGTWYYVENGVLNWNYIGLVEYYGTWYYVENGVLNWNYIGLVEYYGAWYYVENGVLNWNYTGLVEYYGAWYYIENGVLNWNYTGITNYYDVWYYVENGVLNWNRETLVYAFQTWFYIENGQINWNRNTVVYYYGAWYYVNNGYVDWSYNGIWYEYGVLYYVQNGVVTYIQKPETKEEVLAFYQNAVRNVGVSGNAGYSYKEWWYFNSVNSSNGILNTETFKDTFEDMNVSEEDAEKYYFSKGTQEANAFMPLGNCSPDSVKSATIKGKGDNYIITIVMKDQVNPQKTDTDGISAMSNNIMYADDMKSSLGQSVGSAMTNLNVNCKYEEYTIVAEITKNGEIVSIKHSSMVYTEVTGKLLSEKMDFTLGMELYEEFTDFIY